MGQHTEMTRHAFISHMEDYMKKLLKDPIHADTDEFLKFHGYDGPKALSVLLKRQNPEDENSAILLKNISIKNNGLDKEGKRLKDTFTVKYRIPRKDYNKKMRNLYINLFESNIIENSPINEGAWGYGEAPTSDNDFIERFKGLTEAILFHPNMGGLCYTQLTDVEQEVNGLYTYDRRPKFDVNIFRGILTQTAAIEAAEVEE